MEVLLRILNAILDILNKKRKVDAVNNTADTIANSTTGNSVRKSNKTFAELSNEHGSDRVE